MKIIICRYVEYVPVIYVTGISGNDISLVDGKSITKLKTETAEYIQQTVETGAGTHIEHNLNLAFFENTTAEDVFKRYKLVFRLTDSTGNIYIVGTQTKPSRKTSLIKNSNETRASFNAVSI